LSVPYTFIVLALQILIFGPLAAMKTTIDIFPDIGIPVIGVAFNYAGMSPDDMSGRLVTPCERILIIAHDRQKTRQAAAAPDRTHARGDKHG